MTAKMMRLQCDDCGFKKPFGQYVLKRLKEYGAYPPECPDCHGVLTPEIKSKGKTDNQKRSRKQEKSAAKRLGGNVQPGSGAGRAKGDVRAPWQARIECKLTRAKSFSLKLSELEKIEKEAISTEKPIFEIEFQGVTPHKRYAVIPGWLLDHFMTLEEGE